MSAAILAKLRVKNLPKQRDTVEIVIKQPEARQEIEIKTKIVDKRATAKFDREAFLFGIQDSRPVEDKMDNAIAPVLAKKDTPLEEPVAKKPTKLKKRLKLLEGDNIPKNIRKPKREPLGVARVIPEGLVQIGSIPMAERLPLESTKLRIKASSYYLNNREIFINFINSLFDPYKQELKEAAESASCENRSGNDFALMAHQEIVRDYVNLYTPYRGVLLYHGLGSGKTCSSIAIAEGMKDSKKVIVMTPASLRRNYYEELKKCGDSLYKKNQFWEFVVSTDENIETLSSVLNLTIDYIKKNGGAWLVNIKKKPNYGSLDSREKQSVDQQLDEMIQYKYQFISYNGLRKQHLTNLTKGDGNGKVNPFDNAVVIVDEAHNLVSRIVNKLSKRKEDSVSMQLYELLMSAENARIILLSGTPIINYPNEIGILFNILRGYIKTWIIKVNFAPGQRVTKDTFEKILSSSSLGGNITDIIDYNASTTTLTVTRNPFGFVNKTAKGEYDGVRISDRGDMSDEDFIGHLTRLMDNKRIRVSNVRVETYKALPDTLDDFKTLFIDSSNNTMNMNMFKRRILGLASYFRSAQENLMPRFTKGSNFFIVDCEMSDFQFGVYEEARVQERKVELNNAKKRKKQQGNELYEDTVSTYRIFSRAFCNYVFPRPEIKRPMPDKDGNDETTQELTAIADEDLLDAGVHLDNVDGRYEADELDDESMLNNDEAKSYDERIKSALRMLNDRKKEFLSLDALSTYSPKFKKMLENITSDKNSGLHLVYSQFRTLEGIGIFKLVLEANGFAEFKIKQVGGTWRVDMPREDMGKPTFVLYTGTESSEQKEIVRNIFNGDWKFIPSSLEKDILAISGNNLFGEVIKVFMITASGAEGISLKNTRFVHIMEPYWHPVRIQQVIGRARRICSHQELPESLRTVDVFLYLMKFSESQLDGEATIELRLKDTSKRDGVTPLTSDQALWEIATLKEEVTDKILDAVKEASIDCSLHNTAGNEKLKCFSFGTVDPNKIAFNGSYGNEDVDAVAEQNIRRELIDATEVTIEGIKYAVVIGDDGTGDVYDYDSYQAGQAVQVGRLVKNGATYKFERI